MHNSGGHGTLDENVIGNLGMRNFHSTAPAIKIKTEF